MAAEQGLAGRVAVITGANRGIGFAIARAFHDAGAHCVMIVRDRAAGEKAADALAGTPPAERPFVAVADVADRGEVASAAMEIGERFSQIDLLVNNAGVLFDEDRTMPAHDMDETILDQTLGVNLKGAIAMCEALLPSMQRGARIINVSSTMGQLTGGSAGYAPAYCISKTALNAYTQALAEDLRERRIMVDCFHPGWAKTRMGGSSATVDPAQAASVALFLATRPQSEKTGLFWRHPGVVIDW